MHLIVFRKVKVDDYFVKLYLAIGVGQKTKACDQTFEWILDDCMVHIR